MDCIKQYTKQQADKVSKLINTYLNDRKGTKFLRVTQETLDIGGVDMVLKVDGKVMNVDEKVTFNYLTKPLHTGFFETISTSNPELLKNNSKGYTKGWFLDNNFTTHYLFVYVTGNTINDIDEVEFILIDRMKIKDYLYSKGVTGKQLLHDSLELRDSKENSIVKNGIKYVKTNTKDKRNGIGFLLWKDAMIQMADLHERFLPPISMERYLRWLEEEKENHGTFYFDRYGDLDFTYDELMKAWNERHPEKKISGEFEVEKDLDEHGYCISDEWIF